MDDKKLTLILAAKDLASREVGKLHGAFIKLHAQLGKVGGGLRATAGHIAAIGKAAAIVGGAGLLGLVGLLGVATGKASDLNESMSKAQVVFGKNAKAITDWSATTATSMGLSQQAALEAAGTLGNLFVSMKLGTKPAADMSQHIVTLAGDLASFNNADPSDVLEALRAGLVGETEPLRKFGINLNDAALRQEAVRLGLEKTTKTVLPPAIKAQAAYSLIMQQSTTAQGDFARTSSGLANQQRILKAVVEDAFAKIGAAVLPLAVKILPLVVTGVTRVAGFLTGTLIPAVQGWIAANRPLIDQIGRFAGTVLTGLVSIVGTVAGAIGGGGKSKGGGGLIATVMKLATNVASFVVPKVQGFIAALIDAGKSVGKVVGPILRSLLPAFGKIVSALFGGGGSSTGGGKKGPGKKGGGTVSGGGGGLVGAIGSLVAVLWGDGSGPLAEALKFVAGVFTHVLLPAIGFVIDRIADLIGWVKDAITWLNSLNLVTQHTAQESIDYHTGKGRAGGGPMFPGQTYRIAENRDETVTMGNNGTAYVSPSAPQRVGGDGDVVNHIHVYVDGKEVATMVDRRLFRDLRRAAPTKGRV